MDSDTSSLSGAESVDSEPPRSCWNSIQAINTPDATDAADATNAIDATDAADVSIISEPESEPLPPTCLRKRETDATESERYQLCAYSKTHSKATQQELSRWFYMKFKKHINQSTVSRR